ncbi:hypothetical protein GCM10011409_37710 [Lentibacillus populi]|uniref:Uncharacterized protein n=1 Tax=Lentibacillus populi TaxID=1827502 RepID=A0A9W5U0R5_9BACI|nr:hypothetical protein GCM10011409_37710 [Lentibacillus populi]
MIGQIAIWIGIFPRSIGIFTLRVGNCEFRIDLRVLLDQIRVISFFSYCSIDFGGSLVEKRYNTIGFTLRSLVTRII